MAYSKDLQTRAVDHFLMKKRNYRETAKIFKIGYGNLHRWVKEYNDTGTITRHKSTGRKPFISTEMQPEFKKFVFENADNNLKTLSEKWLIKAGQKMCESAMSRSIRRAGLTLKKRLFVPQSGTRNHIKGKRENSLLK